MENDGRLFRPRYRGGRALGKMREMLETFLHGEDVLSRGERSEEKKKNAQQMQKIEQRSNSSIRGERVLLDRRAIHNKELKISKIPN